MFERREDSNTQTRYRIAHIPLFSFMLFLTRVTTLKKVVLRLSALSMTDLMLTL